MDVEIERCIRCIGVLETPEEIRSGIHSKCLGGTCGGVWTICPDCGIPFCCDNGVWNDCGNGFCREEMGDGPCPECGEAMCQDMCPECDAEILEQMCASECEAERKNEEALYGSPGIVLE